MMTTLLFGILGFFIGGPVGLVVALFIGAILSMSVSAVGGLIESATTTRCDDCAEKIQRAARVCPHCGASRISRG